MLFVTDQKGILTRASLLIKFQRAVIESNLCSKRQFLLLI